MISRHVASSLALCLTFGWCAESQAQPSNGGASSGSGNAADAGRKREADARFAAGVKLHNDGQEAEARVQFEQANALRPNNVNILFNLARTEQLTGERLGALRHFRACLTDPAHLKPGLREVAERAIDELSARLGHVRVEVPEGGTDVTVDDLPIAYGETLDVLPGDHVAATRSSSGILMRSSVTALAGETVVAHFAPAANAPVVAAAAPGPLASPVVPAPAEDNARPSAASAPVKWVVVGSLGALAVASAAVALGFQGATNTASDDVAALQNEAGVCSASTPSGACSALNEALDRRDRDANLRTGFFVGAGVLAAGAVGTAIFWPRESASRSTAARRWHLRPEAPGTPWGASLVTNF